MDCTSGAWIRLRIALPAAVMVVVAAMALVLVAGGGIASARADHTAAELLGRLKKLDEKVKEAIDKAGTKEGVDSDAIEALSQKKEKIVDEFFSDFKPYDYPLNRVFSSLDCADVALVQATIRESNKMARVDDALEQAKSCLKGAKQDLKAGTPIIGQVGKLDDVIDRLDKVIDKFNDGKLKGDEFDQAVKKVAEFKEGYVRAYYDKDETKTYGVTFFLVFHHLDRFDKALIRARHAAANDKQDKAKEHLKDADQAKRNLEAALKHALE